MVHHEYYMFPYMPMLFIIAGYGSYLLWDKYPVILLFTVFLMPVNAYIRMENHWTDPKKGAFYNQEIRQLLDDAIPDGALTIV